MAKHKLWSKEEVDYLMDNWGTISIKAIAKKLGRSEAAILVKKNKLKLGRFDESGSYITWNQLLVALGFERNGSYKTTSWIENRNFPVKNKKVLNDRVKIVYLDDFWKWAEKNKNFINFSKFEKGMLGIEPEWVKDKRSYDIQTSNKYKKTPWTPKEDEYLTFLLKQHKYNYDEISKEICRTVGAVQRRIIDLGLMERPVKVDNHNKWSDSDKENIKKMILEGVGYEIMSDRLGRSSKAIRGLIYRLYATEALDKACVIIKTDGSRECELEHLEEMILKGANYEVISEKLGYSGKDLKALLYRFYGSESLDRVYKIIKNRN